MLIILSIALRLMTTRCVIQIIETSVYASSGMSSANHLFDTNPVTQWRTDQHMYHRHTGLAANQTLLEVDGSMVSGQWVVAELSPHQTMYGYTMYPSRREDLPEVDNVGHPKSWHIVVSDDRLEWSSVHHVSDQAAWAQELTFQLPNLITSRYVGIIVTKIDTNTTSVTWCAFNGLQFLCE